ncbi:hypothetical protein Ahy_B10g102914 [Arachis hypogaea]|uniref:Uncharacterized protein n=1 Tax=Arachis hypogaea TaxID=3818 RepID=A0A444X356_ARAHY|nr:hypothetical protein Ahy_B10g102914 [Arachis hypogaea]
MFYIHQQTRFHVSMIKLYVAFEQHLGLDVVGKEVNMDELVDINWEEKGCWEIRRYNGKRTCTMGTISQDHAKLDSDTIADAVKLLVEADPSIKVKSIIIEVQSKFNYTVSYHKIWLAK